ncbi:U-box domain-containing protein 21-like [Nicotiana tomentosiformis]|uniref:U-box domain-containing protein 21-like n=1 Tax=Nicotiana tomentosiformis TaxID=4098 RepID=UPI00051AD450|nr:U-box domain-containing protein 21-like [Nicotiana tomentosiformis]
MMSTWRKRRAAKRSNSKKELIEEKTMELLMIPSHFKCPISLDLMKDPVTLSTGITYDRESIETWIEGGNQTCPITKQVLKYLEPIPNHTMRKMIQQWCVENKDHGVERIPTPRIPVTSSEATEILREIESCCSFEQHDSKYSCRELVLKVKIMIKESARNRRCFVTNGAGKILSSTLLGFSEKLSVHDVETMDEILSALTILLPLDGESKSILGSKSSLNCLVWFLKCGSLSSRRNSVLLLKEIMRIDEKWRVEELLKNDGVLEALVKLVKEPICPTTTKASLLTIYHMVNSSHSINEKAKAKFADLGLVELLVETLVDCEKSICEKVLGILVGICSSEEGKRRAYGYALTIPILIKKLLRVSDLATEFSVSILWKLIGKNEKRENIGGNIVLIEALQVGAFQKLLLLIQVGCSERTKEKASELLKLLNLHRGRIECIDSLDLNNLKRPF